MTNNLVIKEQAINKIKEKIKNKYICNYAIKKIQNFENNDIYMSNSIIHISNNKEKLKIEFIPDIENVVNVEIQYTNEMYSDIKIIEVEKEITRIHEDRIIKYGDSTTRHTLLKEYKDNKMYYKVDRVIDQAYNTTVESKKEVFIFDDVVALKETLHTNGIRPIYKYYVYDINYISLFESQKELINSLQDLQDEILIGTIEKYPCTKEKFEEVCLNKKNILKK